MDSRLVQADVREGAAREISADLSHCLLPHASSLFIEPHRDSGFFLSDRHCWFPLVVGQLAWASRLGVTMVSMSDLRTRRRPRGSSMNSSWPRLIQFSMVRRWVGTPISLRMSAASPALIHLSAVMVALLMLRTIPTWCHFFATTHNQSSWTT